MCEAISISRFNSHIDSPSFILTCNPLYLFTSAIFPYSPPPLSLNISIFPFISLSTFLFLSHTSFSFFYPSVSPTISSSLVLFTLIFISLLLFLSFYICHPLLFLMVMIQSAFFNQLFSSNFLIIIITMLYFGQTCW